MTGVVFDRPVDMDDETVVQKMREASKIIVNDLSDHALHDVRSAIRDPAAMMVALYERYDSETTNSDITKMVELVSVRYNSLKESMRSHADKNSVLVEQLRAVGIKLDNPMAIIIYSPLSLLMS